VWTAKRAALEIIRQVPLTLARRAAFDGYRRREGAELDYWASWCALAERHGPDWRAWPARFRDRDAGRAAVGADDGLRGAAEFHAWAAWLVDDQLAAAQRAALAAGMARGVVHDLAVGVHPGGADAWAHQDLLVAGISVGAPPDSFNQKGQDWAQPPWHPQRLAAAGYEPLADLFAAAFQHAGGLRVDHVMGLMRLWWVPDGMSADRGAYVRYDHEAAVAALAGQAAKAGGVAIGEDLGTVDPWISRYLAEHAILGTMMLWFASEPDGSPLRPAHWRPDCMATVGTHDVPPVAGFLTGDQVTERAHLGLLTTTEQEERERSAALVTAWRDALVAEGLLAPGERLGTGEFTVALYGYLARTPAALVGVSLADAVGDTRSQNIPGTSDEYPNWQIPLSDESGRPVLLGELPALPLVRAVARAAFPRQDSIPR
jgi:4-alpha-glucanotransferase